MHVELGPQLKIFLQLNYSGSFDPTIPLNRPTSVLRDDYSFADRPNEGRIGYRDARIIEQNIAAKLNRLSLHLWSDHGNSLKHNRLLASNSLMRVDTIPFHPHKYQILLFLKILLCELASCRPYLKQPSGNHLTPWQDQMKCQDLKRYNAKPTVSW